jgi:hypothetical protein
MIPQLSPHITNYVILISLNFFIGLVYKCNYPCKFIQGGRGVSVAEILVIVFVKCKTPIINNIM